MKINFQDYILNFKKSKKIFCVSKFTLDRCKYYFPKYESKFILNYIGLSKNIIEYAKAHNEEVKKENNIIYVGNVKPHKGINILLDAFAKLNDDNLTLKIIGQKEKFLVGIKYDEDKYKNVVFTGRLSDEELLNEIAKAKYLVQPSLYEGFGIPPLEAMYLGTTPIISDIPVFKEIYKDFPVTFFEAGNSLDLAEKIKLMFNASTPTPASIPQKYSFEKTASIILDNLQNINRNN